MVEAADGELLNWNRYKSEPFYGDFMMCSSGVTSHSLSHNVIPRDLVYFVLCKNPNPKAFFVTLQLK